MGEVIRFDRKAREDDPFDHFYYIEMTPSDDDELLTAITVFRKDGTEIGMDELSPHALVCLQYRLAHASLILMLEAFEKDEPDTLLKRVLRWWYTKTRLLSLG